MADAAKNRRCISRSHTLSSDAGQTLMPRTYPESGTGERWPVYPGGDLAAQTIGIVSYGSSDTLTGQTGLEAEYDDTLSRSGSLYSNFFAEIFSNVGNMLVSADNAREGDVVTTIEPEVETRLLSDLAKVNTQYSSQGTGGIIMDPHTGAIIALGSVPTFDPMTYKMWTRHSCAIHS